MAGSPASDGKADLESKQKTDERSLLRDLTHRQRYDP
jgi:hypothetical protein